MIKNIATVAIYVSDQKKSLEFYTKVLGFELRNDVPLQEGSEDRWLELAPPNAETRVVLYPQSMMKDWKKRKASIIFQCDNIEELVKNLREEGVTIIADLKEMKWGKFAVIRDPDGNDLMLRGNLD